MLFKERCCNKRENSNYGTLFAIYMELSPTKTKCQECFLRVFMFSMTAVITRCDTRKKKEYLIKGGEHPHPHPCPHKNTHSQYTHTHTHTHTHIHHIGVAEIL